MSCCCSNEQPEYKYEAKTIVQNEHGFQEVKKYVNSPQDLDHSTRHDDKMSITKVNTKIGLETLKKKIEGTKYTDETFPPDNNSLGDVPGNISWRRVRELLKNMSPILFDRKIQPSDVISGHTGDCYLPLHLVRLLSFLIQLGKYLEAKRKTLKDSIKQFFEQTEQLKKSSSKITYPFRKMAFLSSADPIKIADRSGSFFQKNPWLKSMEAMQI